MWRKGLSRKLYQCVCIVLGVFEQMKGECTLSRKHRLLFTVLAVTLDVSQQMD